MNQGRILAVDLGEKRIGLAVSDPSRTIASPVRVVSHTSGAEDAAKILQVSSEMEITLIVVGVPIGDDGQDSPQVRHSTKFAELLKSQTQLKVILWDESNSTNRAQEIRQKMGVSRKNRTGHLDDLAAAVILQSFLDAGAPVPE
jgi:putative Holliday junction resolvase